MTSEEMVQAIIKGVIGGIMAAADGGGGDVPMGDEAPPPDLGGDPMGGDPMGAPPDDMPPPPPGPDVGAPPDGMPDDKAKYEFSSASAANTYVPSPIKDREMNRMSKSAPDADVVRYEKENQALRTQVEALSQFVKDQGEQIRKLERYNRDSHRSFALHSLRNEGYALDVDAELEDTSELPDEKFERHLEKIRTRYARDAAKVPLLDAATPEPADKQPDKDEVDAAVLYYTRYGRNTGRPPGDYLDLWRAARAKGEVPEPRAYLARG